MKSLPTALIAAVAAAQAQAVTTINWTDNAGDNKWSSNQNWQGDNIPDNNDEQARYIGGADRLVDVDQNFTINSYIDGFAGEAATHSLYGAGTLTIDRNDSATGVGIDNATGNAGGTLRFNGNVTIANSQGGITTIRNQNSSGNVLLFDTGSVLVTNTLLETVPGNGVGSIQMNGTLGASSANLRINSPNVSFGTGHDSSGYGRDIVFLGNSKLAVDGGTVLAAGRKFQVNGSAELELNGANTINGANITVNGTNTFLLDVNANQGTMGLLNSVGNLTIDLDSVVSLVSFADSSAQDWGTGTVTISGFQEGVIRFGTDAGGLSLDQLAAIDGGAYTLDSNGFLTAVPEPGSISLLGLGAFALMRRRRRA